MHSISKDSNKNDVITEIRSDWVDYAKCIGILLVVYGHVSRGVNNAGIDIPHVFYQWTDSIIYTFHMPLFFFLSGLFFCHSLQKKGGLSLIFSKVDTVFYPYIMWSIFQGSIEAGLSSYTNSAVTFKDVFSLLSEPRAQFWFLYTLFIAFILGVLLFVFFRKRTMPVLILLSLLMYAFSSYFFFNAMTTYILNNFVFFVLGIVFTRYFSIRMVATPALLLVWMLFFIVGQYFYHIDDGLTGFYKVAAELGLVIFSLLFVIAVSYQASLRPQKWLVLIGVYSMAIYLMHILVGSGVRIALIRFFDIDSYIVHLVVGVTCATLLPLLCAYVIRKYSIPYIFSAPISTFWTKQ